MKLNKENIIEVTRKSLSNAEELINDALLLEQNQRYARAYTLYQLSIEEIGKALISFYLLIQGGLNDEKNVKKFKKDFLSHQIKTKQTTHMDFLLAKVAFKGNPKEAVKFLEHSVYESDNVKILNNYKNYSLYTSYIEGVFVKPSEVIGREKVENIKFRAKTRFYAANAFLNIGIDNVDRLMEYINQFPIEDMNAEKIITEYWNEISDG